MAVTEVANEAFPHLTDEELDVLRPMAREETYRDGDVVFKAGQADIDFFAVEEGGLEIFLGRTVDEYFSRSTDPRRSKGFGN